MPHKRYSLWKRLLYSMDGGHQSQTGHWKREESYAPANYQVRIFQSSEAIAQTLYKPSHPASHINRRKTYNISADNEFAYYCSTWKLFLCKLLHLLIVTSTVITGFLLFHMCVTQVRKQGVTLLSLQHWRMESNIQWYFLRTNNTHRHSSIYVQNVLLEMTT